jgi:hypothetical protein
MKLNDAQLEAMAIICVCILLFGPIIPAIIFDAPGWLFISLFTLILLLAG